MEFFISQHKKWKCFSLLLVTTKYIRWRNVFCSNFSTTSYISSSCCHEWVFNWIWKNMTLLNFIFLKAFTWIKTEIWWQWSYIFKQVANISDVIRCLKIVGFLWVLESIWRNFGTPFSFLQLAFIPIFWADSSTNQFWVFAIGLIQ